MNLTVDVCVIGGGPAGASAARRLATLGHSVVLVEKDQFPRPHVGESLHGGILPLLEVLDVRGAVEGAGFFRPKSTLVHWQTQSELREIEGAPGFQVDRGRFDQILLESARTSGVQVLQPARVVEIKPAITVCEADGRRTTVDAQYVVDASGRSSAFAGRKTLTGRPTLALFAYFRDVEWIGPDTRLEAGPSAWFWGAPIPGGLFNATVFVDNSAVVRGNCVKELYLSLLASSKLLRCCILGSMQGPVKVCDAASACCNEFICENVLRCGDAAFTIDPLSSQGVQTAIGSALHAAAVIHTILCRPRHEDLARRFYVDRLRKSARLHRHAGSRLYSDAARVHPGTFWVNRGDPDNDLKPAPITSEATVRVHPEARFDMVPVLSGEFIAPALGVRSPGFPERLVFFNGIQIAPLLETINAHMSVADVTQHWSRVMAPENALRLIQILLTQRILLSSPKHGH